MKRGTRNLGAVLAAVVGLGVAGCGSTKTVTVVHTDTATVVQTTTVTDTVTVTRVRTRTKTVTAAAPASNVNTSSSGAPASDVGDAIASNFVQALQKALGSSDQVSAEASCTPNATPGTYDCFDTGNGLNQYDYSVTAANGRWTGTVNAANQGNSEPSSLSGTY